MNEVFECSERTQRCWRCSSPVSPQDKYCHNCAIGLGSRIPWYYSHFGIIFLTFAALGPFSLYLVWKSPRISPTARKIYTVLIALFTVLLVMAFMTMYNTLREVLGGYDSAMQF